MKKLSPWARVYILTIILLGTAVSTWLFRGEGWHKHWVLLASASAIACVTQVLKVEGATHQSSYNTSWMVYGFVFTFLGAPATLFVILVSHLVEWAWHRYPWYIQVFNIATYALSVQAAALLSRLIDPPHSLQHLWGAAGLLAAIGAFTLVNHLLVGLVLKLARGESLAHSGVFATLTLMIDFSLLSLGSAAALIWRFNPFASVLTIIPLYIIYSTLKVPALQRQTELDPKTGLFNSAYLGNVLRQELARANRFDRPLTLVMCDLDLLRNINNTYGHLAGDVVLISTARILQKLVREYDVVARFGGEEFCILMPETTLEAARPRIEELRAAIEAAEFEITTSLHPIKATMSFGISARQSSGETVEELLHAADLAVYQAKLSGRNRVYIFSGQPDGAITRLRPDLERFGYTPPELPPRPVVPAVIQTQAAPQAAESRYN